MSQQELKELAELRAAKRAKLRAAYQRMYNNPFRTSSPIFDPIAFRYEAARAFAREYYKITPRSIAIPIALVSFTFLMQRMYNKDVEQRETSIKTGESTYYDRAMWRAKSIY